MWIILWRLLNKVLKTEVQLLKNIPIFLSSNPGKRVIQLPFNHSDHHRSLLRGVWSWQWLSAMGSTICLLFSLPLVRSHWTGAGRDGESLVPWPSTSLSSRNPENNVVSVARTIDLESWLIFIRAVSKIKNPWCIIASFTSSDWKVERNSKL